MLIVTASAGNTKRQTEFMTDFSVFVGNKPGTLIKVLELMKENEMQLIASTIYDTVEYGIYAQILKGLSRL